MKPHSSCLNCDRRTIDCHDTCEDYKQYRKELDEYNERERELTMHEHRLNDYTSTVMAKSQKRKRRML